MAILAVDEVMLREPRLLVPGMQPLGPVRVDPSHPLSNGLIFWKLFNDTSQITGSGGGPTLVGNSVGRGIYFDGTDDYVEMPRRSFTGFQSFACGLILHTWSSDEQILSAGSANIDFDNNALFFGAGNTNKLAYGRVASAGTWRDEGTAIVPGKYTKYCWTWNDYRCGPTVYNGNLIRCFKDGREDGTANNYTDSTDRTILETGSTFYMAVDKYSTTYRRHGNCTLFYVFVWNRALSPSEATSVSYDPYQFLIPA